MPFVRVGNHEQLLLTYALLEAGYFDGVGAFFAFFDFEFYPVSFLNLVDKAGLMDEDFFLVVVGDDEAEAFGVVVKLNGTGEHGGGGEMIMRRRCR